MMKFLLVAAVAGSICAAGVPVLADVATAFDDTTCPQANDSGRKLNDLNARGDVNGDDLMAAAEGLVDAYKDCARSFDESQNTNNARSGDHLSDYIPVNRMYSRYQLAVAYQRVGSFYEQLHEPAKARTEYDLALQPLDEVQQILSAATTGIVDRGSSEYKISQKAQTLHDQIVASEAKLPV